MTIGNNPSTRTPKAGVKNRADSFKASSLGDKVLDIVFFLVIAFAVIVTLYPFLYVVSVSISDGQAVARGDVLLWPKGFSLDAFKMVVEYEQLGISYGNTLF